MFIFFSQSDGGIVSLFTLTITIKESLAGGNASWSVSACVMIFVSSFTFCGSTKRPNFLPRTEHEMVTVSHKDVSTKKHILIDIIFSFTHV